MAALFLSNQNMKYESLLELSNEELLLSSMNLVDTASTDSLKHCYNNIFIDSIMRYLLKIVIKQEIENVSASNCDDWKRISLIKKITKLTEVHTSNAPPSNPMYRYYITQKNNKINRYETSTDILLLSGYIRNEMGIKNNDNFPNDILSICQYFINDCSNIIPPQQLMIYNHRNNKYKSVFSDTSTFQSTAKSMTDKAFGSKFLSLDVKKKLITPYKIMTSIATGSYNHYYDKIPHQQKATDISANINEISPPQYGDKEEMLPTLQVQSPPLTSRPPSNMDPKSILGVVQYLDINRCRLLAFGGIEKREYDNQHSYIYSNFGQTSYNTRNSIIQFNLKPIYSHIGNTENNNVLLPNLKKKNSAPMFVSGTNTTRYASETSVSADDANIITTPIIYHSSTSTPSVADNSWCYSVNRLLYGRGYMSLCEIENTYLAIIGGKTYIQKDMNMNPYQHQPLYYNTSYEECVLDCVELYNLEKDIDVNVAIKQLNHGRIQCGSYYNYHRQEIIVFGGHKINNFGMSSNQRVSHMMEIYDFHKNTWFDIPYLTQKMYDKYPCIWTVGSKCIFVAKMIRTSFNSKSIDVECEWIDLRVCDKNGRNKSKFNLINTIDPIDLFCIETTDHCSMFIQS